MNTDSSIYVAGHAGLVGSALCRALRASGHTNLISRASSDLDLRDAAAVGAFFASERPEYVFLAAGTVGGIQANRSRQADFIHDNLAIALNVIKAAHDYGARKLLFLGSSCIYPKHALQPIKEEYLMSGPLEPTNESYAIAKIAGMQLCRAYSSQHGCRFISVMPTNLYGPGDNYALEHAHVLPALIRKFHGAKAEGAAEVRLWGSGSPLREFLHSDDLAEACLLLMDVYDSPAPINVGSGQEVSIRSLAAMVADAVGYTGSIRWDTAMPDGTPRKLLDSSKALALGWQPKVALAEGIRATYRDFLAGNGRM